MRILSTGIAEPQQVTSSTALDRALGRPGGCVQRLSGVVTRRFAAPDELQSELAATAVRQAAARAGIPLNSIDLLVSASALPEQALPNTACAVLRQLGLSGVASFDVNNSCLSFMTAFHLAANLLSAGAYRRIAVVSCDLASRGLDWSEPEASLIFGDGAAAIILEAGEGSVDAFVLETYPEGFAHCQIRAGGSLLAKKPLSEKDALFQMEGKSVFKLAAKTLPGVVDRALNQARATLADIEAFVPHQASHLGLTHMTRLLGLPTERTINIYADHGNQVAASLPTALHHAFERGLASPGKRVMLLGTAAGFSAGAMIVRL